MTKSDNPYCIDCYMKHFARVGHLLKYALTEPLQTCDSCQKKIGPDEKRLNYQDLHWHADPGCFQ